MSWGTYNEAGKDPSLPNNADHHDKGICDIIFADGRSSKALLFTDPIIYFLLISPWNAVYGF